MGDRTTDGPAMRRSMQTDMRTTRHLNHFLPIPTSGVGTVLVKSDPATTQGIPTIGSHQSSCGRMLPGRVDRFGQNAVFTKRCFPAVRANSRRHPQPQAAVIQNKQLMTAAMRKQLQTRRRSSASCNKASALASLIQTACGGIGSGARASTAAGLMQQSNDAPSTNMHQFTTGSVPSFFALANPRSDETRLQKRPELR